MNRIRIFSLALAASLPLMTGCLLPFAGLQLNADDNGTAVTTSLSTNIRVTLDSNATTGFQWEIAELDTSVVENTANTYIAPVSTLVGAGGREQWDFTAVGAGTTVLRMEYRRPFDPEETTPADTFTVTITVE